MNDLNVSTTSELSNKKENVPSRNFGYDVVRAVAIIFVLCVHAKGFLLAEGFIGTNFHLLAPTLFFTANAMFFFMSGKFNIKERSDDGLPIYYVRKLRNLLLPALVFSAFAQFVSLVLSGEGMSLRGYLTSLTLGFLGGYGSGVHWFLFTVFGFLLAAPFFSKAILSMSDCQQKWFLGLGISYSALTFVCANLSIDFGWKYYISGWAFCFFAGAFAESFFAKNNRKNKLAAAYIISWILIYFAMKASWYVNINDLSPMYLVISMGNILLLLKIAKFIETSKIISKVFSMIARHSFGIFLLHWNILFFIGERIGYHQGVTGFLYFLLIVIATLAVSMGLVVIINLLIIKPLQKIFDFILCHLKRGQVTC